MADLKVEGRKRQRLGQPVNAPVELHDGRSLIVRSGKGSKLVARQKRREGEDALEVGEHVFTPLVGGRYALMEVVRWRGKNVEFKILGSVDAPED